MLATGGVALASDSAATGKMAATGKIRACYQPGSQPAALAVLTHGRTKCPAGDKKLTWNIVGPQGPPGLGTGVTSSSSTQTPIDSPNPADADIVLTAPAVPVSGVYYVTATVSALVDTSDFVACSPGPDNIESETTQFGPAPAKMSTTVAVNGALQLTAGQTPAVGCIDLAGDSNTTFLEGLLNATLINSSTGPSGADGRGRAGSH